MVMVAMAANTLAMHLATMAVLAATVTAIIYVLLNLIVMTVVHSRPRWSRAWKAFRRANASSLLAIGVVGCTWTA
jgi:uncharacterized membrane protein YqjE